MKSLAFACALLSFASGACSGDDPQCVEANCGLEGHTVVKWMFDHYPERGFQMDSCVDFGALKVTVDVVDAAGVVTSGIDDCGAGQVTFTGLAEGDYTVYVMPLDATGQPLANTPSVATVTAGTFGNDKDVSVNVPWQAWIGSYTGTFLFRISWGGMSCDLTDIKRQAITLTAGGQVAAIMTDDGEMLDGSNRIMCKKFTDNFPQSATGVPFGPATITIDGYDDNDHPLHHQAFDTFIGAGITNPTQTFDVPLT